MYIIFLDTETSGLHGTDRIIEFGIVVLDENMNTVFEGSDYCHIHFKLSNEVSEYNGIKDSDLVNAKKIKDTPTYKEFEKYNNEDNIVVIHNSWFDMYMMYLSHIKINCRVIDTLNCSRSLYKENESHTLEYLTNNIVKKADDKPIVQKHRAIDDCKLLVTLFNHLLKSHTVLDLISTSEKRVIPFGKHKGKLWSEVDKGYLRWAHDRFLEVNSPEQLYVKRLIGISMSPQQEKLSEYLQILN